MHRILNVHFLPNLVEPSALAGHTAIVVDVLRASTTITAALDSRARRILPCLSVDDARQRAHELPDVLLGGERQGLKLPGFDLGNSPAEYTPDRVAGKTIVFTTTNGTKAMSRCVEATQILIGSLVNRAALCRAVADHDHVDIVCAGTNGEFSMEDALAAGAMAQALPDRTLNDAAYVCKTLWEHQQCHEVLAQSRGGRNLIRLGMQADLLLAAQLDQYDIVPELHLSIWEISPRESTV